MNMDECRLNKAKAKYQNNNLLNEPLVLKSQSNCLVLSEFIRTTARPTTKYSPPMNMDECRRNQAKT